MSELAWLRGLHDHAGLTVNELRREILAVALRHVHDEDPDVRAIARELVTATGGTVREEQT